MKPFRIARSFGLSLLVLIAGQTTSVHAQVDPGVTLDWQASTFELAAAASNGGALQLPGYAILKRPGQPEVPFTSQLIALPAGSRPTLEIVSRETQVEALSTPLAIAPAPGSVVRDAGGEIIGGAYDATDDLERVAAPTGGPTAPVVLETIGRMRGVDLARVVFYPLVPDGNTLQVTTAVQVRVHYNAPDGAQAAIVAGDDFADLLATRVANPEVLQIVAAAPAMALEQTQAAANTAMIEVDGPGLTAITVDALVAAGFPTAGVDPALLKLTRAGSEIRMRWEGDNDAVLETGERLLFYADPRFNRYTTRDVYELTPAASPVARMSTRAALTGVVQAGVATATATFEQNSIYTPLCACGALPADRDGDRWVWEDLRAQGRPSVGLPFTLTGVAAAQPAASLTVWMVSYTTLAADPDHRATLTLNGTSLGTFDWDGRQAITQTVAIPQGVLLSGSNTLTVTLPGLTNVSPEGAWLDAFQVTYATTGGAPSATVVSEAGGARLNTVTLSASGGIGVYDITSPNAPISLDSPTINGAVVSFNSTAGGQRFTVVSGGAVRSPAAVRMQTALSGATGANYLIISHSSFLASVGALRDWRVGRGLSVAVENAQAIYDAYDGGRPTADAIAAFIADAYAHWSPRPAYVLLVGDATYDPKRYRTNSNTTYIPPYLAVVDPWLGETASDNRYAAVDGADTLPDLALGRLPVNSPAEAQTVIGKIVAYEQSPAAGFWDINALYVADNIDGAGDFQAASNALITGSMTPPFRSSTAYFNPAATNGLTETRQTITATVNLGVGLLVYNGHASMRQWAAERLFHMDDANQLTNGGRLPIVLSMTCFTGSFHDAGLSTLDESLVRRAGGGAIGTWGPTGLGIASGHDALADGFLTRVYVNRQPDVGAAILAGKLELANRGQYLDLIDTFTWLGDPATRVNLVTPAATLNLPVIRR